MAESLFPIVVRGVETLNNSYFSFYKVQCAAEYRGNPTSYTSNTMTDTNQDWETNELSGSKCQIIEGTGSGATEYSITGNTATQITISETWSLDETSGYRIYNDTTPVPDWDRAVEKTCIGFEDPEDSTKLLSETVEFDHTIKDHRYYFRIKVIDTFGEETAWSNIEEETSGDEDRPNEITSTHMYTGVGDLRVDIRIQDTYVEVDDLHHYDWWVNTTDSFPSTRDPDYTSRSRSYSFGGEWGVTFYVFVRAVDRSGNVSINYANRKVTSAGFNAAPDPGDISQVTYSGSFSASDYNTVAWEAGTMRKTNGDTQSVDAGYVDVDSDITYIYMDEDDDDPNILKDTETHATAVGENKVIFAIAQANTDTSKNAIVQSFVSESTDPVTITAENIVADTITADCLKVTDVYAQQIQLYSGGNIHQGISTFSPATGDGFILGDDSGTTKFIVGDFDNDRWIWWNGTTLEIKSDSFILNTDGTITATGGTIGGFSITSARLNYNNDIILQATGNNRGYFISDNGGQTWQSDGCQIDYNGGDVRFYVGSGSNHLQFDPESGFLHVYGGGLTISGDDTNPYIGLNKTVYAAGDGIWLGKDGFYWKWFVGQAAAQRMVYDGNDFGIYDSNNVLIFEVNDTTTKIGQWIINSSDGLFKSAASGTRIELNPAKNRVSIFDASDENVVMGYLEGLQKNPYNGWCTSSTNNTLTDSEQKFVVDELIGGTIKITEGTGIDQERTISDNTATQVTISSNWTTNPDTTSKYRILDYGTWTSSDYGFWAQEGDHLRIDGDVRYESGDWIIQHDSSFLVEDANDNVIIRMGTDTGEKGFFIYDPSGTQLAKMVTDEIYIGETGDFLRYTPSGGLEISGSITLTNTIDASDISDVDPYVTGQDEQTLNGLNYDTPSGSGLYMDATHLGYYSGSTWMTYMSNAGHFYLGGTSGKLQWNGTALNVEGNITVTGGNAMKNDLSNSIAYHPIGDNLVFDPDMEFSDVTYWVYGTSSYISKSTTQVHANTQSLRMEGRTDQGTYGYSRNGITQYQRIKVEPNSVIFASAWVYLASNMDAVNDAKIQVWELDANMANNGWTQIAVSNQKSAWHKIEGSVTLQNDTEYITVYIGIVPAQSASGHYTYFDDVEYRKTQLGATDDTVANSKIKTFYQDGIPTSISIGDLWVDTNDYNQEYRAAIVGANEIKAGEWESVRDTTIPTSGVGKITMSDTPSGAGLYLGANHLGYYDSSVWNSFLKSNGEFYLGGEANGALQWDGSTLAVEGDIVANSLSLQGAVIGDALLDPFYFDSNNAYIWHFDSHGRSTKNLAPKTETAVSYYGNQGKFGGGIVLGEDATNVIDEHDLTLWSGTAESSAVVSTDVKPPVNGAVVYKLTLSDDASSAPYWHEYTSLIATTYTYALYIMPTNIDNYKIGLRGGSAGDVAYTNKELHKWHRAKVTTTYTGAVSRENIIFTTDSAAQNGGEGVFYVCAVQIEDNGYATPFTDGTRSNARLNYLDTILVNSDKSLKEAGTIAFWFDTLDNHPLDYGRILYFKDDSVDSYIRLGWFYNSGNQRMQFAIRNSGTNLFSFYQDSSESFAEHTKYFVVARWNNSTTTANLDVYKENGTKMYTLEDTSWPTTLPTITRSNSSIYLGCSMGDQINALIDELLILDYYASDDIIDTWFYQAKPFHDGNEDLIKGSGRVIIDDDGITGYNDSGNETFKLDADGNTITGGKLRTADESSTSNQAIVLNGADNTLKFFKSGRSAAGDFCIIMDDDIKVYDYDHTLLEKPGIEIFDGVFRITHTDINDKFGGINVIYETETPDTNTNDFIGFSCTGDAYDTSLSRTGRLMGFRSMIYNTPSTVATLDQHGIYSSLITDKANSNIFGIYTKGQIETSGSGDAYGVYAIGQTAGSGVAYGIFASGYGGYAGYFDDGDVYIKEDLEVHGVYKMDTATIIDASRNTDFNNINADGVYQMDGSDIIDSSKQQTGDFKTRSFLQFGRSVTMNVAEGTLTDYLAGVDGVDSADGGSLLIADDCIVTSAALSTVTAMDFTNGTGTATCVVTLQKASNISNSWSGVGTLLSLAVGDDAYFGKQVSNLSLTLSPNDRIRVKFYLNATAATSNVTIAQPQIVLGLLSE